MLTHERFLKSLRSTLNHLYDPDRLRASPLAEILGVADRFDTPSRLQRILIQAIESLEPPGNDPPGSSAWSIYEPLYYRYVEQLSQQEIARQMGICDRHLRRKQFAALQVLADRLWEQFSLEGRLGEASVHEISPAEDRRDVNDNLAWLKDETDVSVDLDQILPTILERARPLAARYQAELCLHVEGDIPSLAVHPVALTQMLLNVLGVAVHRAPGGTVQLAVKSFGTRVRIEVEGWPSSHAPALLSGSDAANLDMAHQLAHLSGGRLTLVGDPSPAAFGVQLALPTYQQVPVLIIDDNVDALELLQRYASDTRYHVIVARDPEQALRTAQRTLPEVIVLDVMMPQLDGWEALARLRQHPLTAHIPVIVCTILAQEELALSLGANAFIRKPVTRQDFLQALDRQLTNPLGSR
jgi:CheY-like chemotaxis protein